MYVAFGKRDSKTRMDDPHERQTEEFLGSLLKQRTDDYLSRGRRFHAAELPALIDLWVAAFRNVFMNNRSDRIPDMDDLTVELGLRHVDPPAEKVAAEIALLLKTGCDSATYQILEAIDEGLAESKKFGRTQ
jgi:hypothetical protein